MHDWNLDRNCAIDQVKIQLMEWQTVFTDTSNKGLKSKIYKELIKLNTNPPPKQPN